VTAPSTPVAVPGAPAPTAPERARPPAGEGAVLLGRHAPVDLLGWRAPVEVDALAFVGTGLARAEPAHGRRDHSYEAGGGRDGRSEEVRVAVAVARDGQVAGLLHLDGRVRTDAPRAGRLHDTLHRCLELPTPAPPTGTGQLIDTLWVAGVLDAAERAERAGGRLGWAEVLACHPAVGAVGTGGAKVDPPVAEIAIRVARRAWSWETLRCQAATEGTLADLCPPALAGWMDEGMFARWVLDGLLPATALLGHLDGLLEPAAAAALRSELARCQRHARHAGRHR